MARYRYHTHWSAEDGEYVVTVAAYPSLSSLAPTAAAAEADLRALVTTVEADMASGVENNLHG